MPGVYGAAHRLEAFLLKWRFSMLMVGGGRGRVVNKPGRGGRRREERGRGCWKREGVLGLELRV